MVSSSKEKQEALERALRSRTFARSDQLRRFLSFVCQAEMEGRSSEVTEYVIGVEVLGRPEGYSPGEDSSVRTRAYELRQKLERLYATELTEEPLHIEVAKGSYIPQYVRPRTAAEVVPETVPEVVVGEGKRPAWVIAAATLLAGLILGAGGVLFWRREAPAQKLDPVVAEAWGPLAGREANVLLCAATPLHLVVGPEGHQAFGSQTYPAPAEAYPLFRQHRPLEPNSKLGLIFTDNVLGVGTMNAVVAVSSTLRSFGAGYQILPERAAALSAIRGRNAVLFGAPVDSEAITRTMEHAPLAVDYDDGPKEFVIRDRVAGRSIVPRKNANGDFVDVYGLVTVLNTRESERGRLGMVVFSGITSTGTHGAAEFFSSPKALRNLKAILAREGLKGFPAAYQVVVRCTFSNMLLVGYEYHSHRVLQRD